MGHLPGLISDLALILITGAITTILLRRIRQPLVLERMVKDGLIRILRQLSNEVMCYG